MDRTGTITLDRAAAGRPEALSAASTRIGHRLALLGTLLLSAFLSFFRLAQEGYANLYYAAGIKSMLTSWHDFFFVSFDAAGFVSIDKPPLGLWIQAASAALLGFSGFSILLPQALAAVLSVALLYHLVQRRFGRTAGLIAALVLAVTPISVATSRNNTMDSVLVFVLLLAAWAALRTSETGRLRWLALCAVLVGLGFNIKMLQAFLVVPAFWLVYLLGARPPWPKRFWHLTLATVVLLAVALSWAVAVDLTPPDQRPYVGSSQDNTVMELIIGHNGLKRLLPGGLRGLTPGLSGSTPKQAAPPAPDGSAPPSGAASTAPSPGGNAPRAPQSQPAGRSETGAAGALRLFNEQLAGQISWLLPLAALGFVVAAAGERPRLPLSPQQQSLLLWAMWLLPQLVFFSVANLFHRYYLAMMAPGIAALVGVGLVAMWRRYCQPGWRGALLPLALLGCAAVEAYIIRPFPAWSRWLTPLVVGLTTVAALALLAVRAMRPARRQAWASAAAGLGVLALLVAPTVWAWIPVWYGGHSGLPFAGPELLTARDRVQNANVEPLVAYLQANHQDETFILATLNAREASPIILATGEPVMALGGFTGGDRILTLPQFIDHVKTGDVRYVLLSRNTGAQRQLAAWVARNAVRVPKQVWLGPPPQAGQPGPGSLADLELFDCRPWLAQGEALQSWM
jgi:4-amino-4-deoxy-L-arabinose transferase-like glycosyltransferase